MNITAIKSDSGGYFNNLETPLIAETKHGNSQTVYTLINHGADIYIRDGNGKSALDYAIQKNYKKIINLLQKKDKENRDLLFKIIYKKYLRIDTYSIKNIIDYVY